jgi:hypothetical protein
MNRHLLLLSTALIFSTGISAQSKQFSIPRGAQVTHEPNSADWFPRLEFFEGEISDEHSGTTELDRLKEQLNARIGKNKTHQPAAEVRDLPDTPYIWKSFQANAATNGVPNDNDIAVSTSGYLMSVCNTNIFKYDLNKDTTLGTVSLATFSNGLGNFYSKYDPKVIYDPDQNKFIVVFLAGFTHSTSSIIVGFSESDFPNGEWNLYELPGNPLNDTLWTDFPMVALTNNELFITVNHLADNESWQTGWRRTVIWQVNKFDGYLGDTLSTQLHYEINYGGKGVRNLCPAKGGSHLYGSDIYFLSQRNLVEQNDTFFLVHLTDTINASSQQLTVEAMVSPTTYFVPVNARQPHTTELATNDSRVLGAFYENDRLQFVGNTTDTLYGTAAIYHGIVENVSSSPTVNIKIISDDTLCYGYPNITYLGNSAGDHTALINMLRSSPVVNPGHGALVTDGQGSYSDPVIVKDGVSYHYYLNGTQRWGDYTGSQRDYNSPGQVWVNGSYSNASHKVSTWASQLGLLPPPAAVAPVALQTTPVLLYPNPSAGMVTLEFETGTKQYCRFELWDFKGRFIDLLMEEWVKPGTVKFSFSSAPLAAGEYILKIISGNEVIAATKVIRQ